MSKQQCSIDVAKKINSRKTKEKSIKLRMLLTFIVFIILSIFFINRHLIYLVVLVLSFVIIEVLLVKNLNNINKDLLIK